MLEEQIFASDFVQLLPFNPILYGVIDQRILHEKGSKNGTYLPAKPKVMELPQSACWLVLSKIC